MKYDSNMDSREILKMRRTMGLSQEAFAHLLGISWATVSRWENGKYKPSQLAVEKILKIQAEQLRKKDRLASV